MANTKDLENQWLSMLKQVENPVSKLLENRFFFRELSSILKRNPNIPANNPFLVWIWENYLLNAAIGVRRLVDANSDSVSLYHLLESIKEHPEILSRERYKKLYDDSGFANDDYYTNSRFDALVGEGNIHIDPKDVDKDIQSIKNIKTGKLITYVDRIIAHYDRRGIKDPPTIKELDDSIDLLEELTKKYYGIITAGGISLLPTVQAPWEEIFEIPWMSKEKRQ